MSEMIERVAKAIWAANGWHAPDEEDRRTLPWTLCVRQARATIEAMREPTDEMVDAGVTSDTGKTLGQRVSNEYRAMIDEALK